MANNKARAAAPRSEQPSWLPTDKASAAKLNTVSGTVEALLDGNYPVQEAAANIIRSVHTVVMQIENVFSDCIVCKDILAKNEPDEDGRLVVAKPFLLRKSLYDDKTRNGLTFAWNDDVIDGGERTTTNEDGEDSIQVITTSYQPGDILMIALGGDPWLTTEVGGRGIVVTAFDMNIDARAWARKNTQELATE